MNHDDLLARLDKRRVSADMVVGDHVDQDCADAAAVIRADAERIKALEERVKALREALKLIWDTVPATFSGPAVKVHSAALNNIGEVLRDTAPKEGDHV